MNSWQIRSNISVLSLSVLLIIQDRSTSKNNIFLRSRLYPANCPSVNKWVSQSIHTFWHAISRKPLHLECPSSAHSCIIPLSPASSNLSKIRLEGGDGGGVAIIYFLYFFIILSKMRQKLMFVITSLFSHPPPLHNRHSGGRSKKKSFYIFF